MLLSLKSVSNRELQLSGSHSYSSFPEIFVGALFRTETTDKLFFKSDRNHVNNLKTRIKKVYDCHRDNRNKAEGYYVKLNYSQQNKTKQNKKQPQTLLKIENSGYFLRMLSIRKLIATDSLLD